MILGNMVRVPVTWLCRPSHEDFSHWRASFDSNMLSLSQFCSHAMSANVAFYFNNITPTFMI